MNERHLGSRPWQSPVLWLMVAYVLVYALTRWYQLTLLPVHFDEIVYLDRVNRMISRYDFFIGLRDDLRTGHLWIIALLWPFSPDWLWVGRFASTLAGILAGLGVYKSGTLLFSDRRTGLIAAAFYLIVPGVLFYDRMALADSLLTACGVWIVYGVSVYVLTGEDRPLWWLGLVMALAMITKPNGFVFLAVPVLGYLCLRRDTWSTKQVTGMALPLAIGGGLSFALMLPFLSKNRGMLWGKAGASGIIGWGDWADRFAQNLSISAGWLVGLLALPIIGLAGCGMVFGLGSRQARRQTLFLALVWSVQWLFSASVSEIWYPRYLLPVAPEVVLLAAYAASKFAKLFPRAPWQAMLAVVLAASTWPIAHVDFWLLAYPPRASLHPEERRQYVTGWPSAYGLAEVASFVQSLAAQYPLVYVVYNENNVMLRKGLRYYLPDAPSNVKLEKFDPFEGGTIEKLDAWAADRPTFVVLNTANEKGLDDFILNPEAFPQARHVLSVPRPGGMTSWDVYQWLARDEADQ